MPDTFFPDRQHIEAIRRALWSKGRGAGAAVMVGAGMSQNAVPTHPEHRRMPDWSTLVLSLIDRLYPAGQATDRRRDELLSQVGATSTAVRLAEEFAATFGRSALDDAVLQAVPDTEFAPGPLHELLLELPWADVLTTNYDTLLERAARNTLGQSYSVVQSPEEIPTAIRPRIAKLHGSFPATRPFILTEEDFRTYPRRFAPFVNLAQQVMMENVFCLVGFSGDDPNFLYWTGWVRDNLGSYAPKIYLCGLLDLSASQRRLLHERNVIPVDFTPLFADDLRYRDRASLHGSALEWFLRSLKRGRPYDPLEWPNPASAMDNQPAHLPELLAGVTNAPFPERFHPS